MCDFCCLVDFEFCSRDIGICEPVTDRHLSIILDCVCILGGIIAGFPIIIKVSGCLLKLRCCESFFVNTSGITCYEALARMAYLMVCIKFSDTFPDKKDGEEEEDQSTKRGPVEKFFYFLFCCFLCPNFYKNHFKKNSSTHAAAAGGE
jgi:hypothetical protein